MSSRCTSSIEVTIKLSTIPKNLKCTMSKIKGSWVKVSSNCQISMLQLLQTQRTIATRLTRGTTPLGNAHSGRSTITIGCLSQYLQPETTAAEEQKKMSVQPQTARKTSCQTPKPNISKCIPSRESQTQHITLTYRTLTGGNPF